MKTKKNIQQTVQEELPEFAAEVASLDTDALNLRLSQLAKDLDEVEQAQDNDIGLEQARANASELAAPYRESKKAVKTKSKYIISLLKDRGAL